MKRIFTIVLATALSLTLNAQVENLNIDATPATALTLHHFSANVQNNSTHLTWQVASNEGGNYFEVAESADGVSFKTAALVSTTTAKNTEYYKFKSKGANKYFRLTVVNNNGSVTYSKVISIKSAAQTSNNLQLAQTQTPNVLTLQYSSPVAEEKTVTIYNLAGVLVQSNTVPTTQVRRIISVALNTNLAAGTYVAQLQGSHTTNTIKFNKK